MFTKEYPDFKGYISSGKSIHTIPRIVVNEKFRSSLQGERSLGEFLFGVTGLKGTHMGYRTEHHFMPETPNKNSLKDLSPCKELTNFSFTTIRGMVGMRFNFYLNSVSDMKWKKHRKTLLNCPANYGGGSEMNKVVKYKYRVWINMQKSKRGMHKSTYDKNSEKEKKFKTLGMI
ncbi:hypothetical protein AVEN_17768-1 [Araneus ventricosus]|uniref:Uncharacterized protein n=1 Tax=Araneus ventricosus TaxID=182803 RepID=A0A4Y2MTL1_ARAVE|nr:hypothetical protein AVEN_17768-1 [Araneus ventricosus]